MRSQSSGARESGRDGGRPAPEEFVRRLRADEGAILVTGASGWFGTTALDLLHDALGPEAFLERVRAFASRRRTIKVAGDTAVEASALDELVPPAEGTLLLVHLAAQTRELVARQGVDRYLRQSLAITAATLGAVAASSPAGLFYTSSGAVYGADRPRLETDLAANPYGFVKHLEEMAFRRAAEEAGTRSVIARVFSGTGPHINKPAVYALRDLIEQGLTSDRIEIRARHRVVRTYSSVRDILAVGMTAALDPAHDHLLFETGGERIEIEELARLVRTAVGRASLPISRNLDPDLPADDYSGNGFDMVQLAARHGVDLLALKAQIDETVADVAGQILGADDQ